MPKRTGLTCLLVACLCLGSGIAGAADENAMQPSAPQTDADKHPQQASEKQPTPKEDTAGKQPNQGDSAKPKEDPNCE